MDSGEDFLLKWNDHHSLFFRGAEKLLENEEYTDVILAAGDRFFSAHRLVLSICSPFFQKLFKHLGNQKSVIYMKDIEPEHLELLLEYMYKGEIKVQESELVNVLSSAQSLEVRGLTDSGKNKKSTNQKDTSNHRSNATPNSGIGGKRAAKVNSDVEGVSSRKRANNNKDITVASATVTAGEQKQLSPPPIKAIKQEKNTSTVNDRASETHRLSESTTDDVGVIASVATSDFGGVSDDAFGDEDATAEDVDAGFDASACYEELGYGAEDGEYFGEEGAAPHLMSTEEDRGNDALDAVAMNPAVILEDGSILPAGPVSGHEPPYMCKFCGKQFEFPSALRKHIVVHTREKPYTCDYCGLGFSQKSSLPKHKKSSCKALKDMIKVEEVGVKASLSLSVHEVDDGGSSCKSFFEEPSAALSQLEMDQSRNGQEGSESNKRL